MTSSPRITEYGRFKEMKKGWNTRSFVASATPIPAALEIPNALAYQLVIVSGTVMSSDLLPSEDLLKGDCEYQFLRKK